MRRHPGPIVRSRALRKLGRAQGCRAAQAMARALRAADDDAAAAEWESRIAARRAELLASDAVIETPLREYTGDPGDVEVERRDVAEICRTDSKPESAGRLLLAIVRELRPRNAIELGSALGISTSYQGAALELVGTGRLVGIEASSARVDVARETLDALGLAGRCEIRHGTFDDQLAGAFHDLGPVGYAFVDGHHEEEATVRYWRALLPHLEPEAIVLFDDISWSEGMARAWGAITADPAVSAAVDLDGMGACVVCGG